MNLIDHVNEAESDVENVKVESEDEKVDGDDDDDDDEEEVEEASKEPKIKLPKYSEHKEK